MRHTYDTWLAMTVTLVLSGGCAVIDGLSHGGLLDGCDTDDDCNYAQICTMSGCRDSSDLGQAGHCSTERDCNGWASSDLPCLSSRYQGQGSCACLAGSCAYTRASACNTDSDCGAGQFCHRDDGFCYQLYDCVTHDDCSYGICTVSGCNSDLPGSFTLCENCTSELCAAYRCWDIAPGCTANSDCTSLMCSAPEGNRCLTLR